MPHGFNAIVFDFDGLIVDTEVPEYEAWLGIFRSYGVDLPLSVWTPHIGGGHDGFDCVIGAGRPSPGCSNMPSRFPVSRTTSPPRGIEEFASASHRVRLTRG